MEEKISQREKEDLYQLYCYAFNREDSKQRRAFFIDRIDHRKIFKIEADHKIVSALYRLPLTLNIGNQDFQMGGIGDVMTYPEYGSRGYASKLLKDALLDMNKDGYELSFLASFAQRYYRRFGYQQVVNHFTYTINAHDLRALKLPIKPRIERTTLDESLDEIVEFYCENIATQTGKLVRKHWWWRYLTLKNNWNVAKIYEDDTLTGYLIYEIVGIKMQVHEFYYLDQIGYQGLINFVAAHASMVDEFIFNDYGSQYHGEIASEEGLMNVKVEQAMMGRIVNFSKFMMKYPFASQFEPLKIKVVDEIISENNGIWQISPTDVHKVDDSAEGWQINDISALFLGSLSLETAIKMQRLGVNNQDVSQLKQLDDAITKNAVCFSDYF